MEEKKKKYLIIGIVAVLLLVIVIAGTAYAVFSANLTGVKENKLTTGYVTMACNETSFTLNNTKPLTDEQGIALDNNAATCTLNTTMNGTMTVGYDVALYDVDSSSSSDSLGEDNVKIQASKVKNSSTTYLAGTSATTGVLVSSLSSTVGQYDTSITGYKIDSATTNQTESVVYTIKGWVANDNGSTTSTTNTEGKCSDETITTKEACQNAGEVWGYNQAVGQAGGSFSFKIKVGATQVLS